jgi:2,4-dienoyl-CoA reductase-like NADH-dependent reductase (Old Yellow Enzyme family)
MTGPADVRRLLSPLTLRPGLQLRNRVVFQPHFTALGRRDGAPSEEHAAYHAERARGGTGLNIFESQAVHITGRMNRHFVHAWDEAVVPRYREVTDAVHAEGGRIFSQLTHGGHTTAMRPPEVLWAPTQVPEPSDIWSTKAMDLADVAAVVEGFASAARNAVAGGFDGVEIKIAHDGLLRSFTSPHFNRRTDQYGGSFENRMRLPMEVLAATREALGDGLALGVRLCLNEYTEWGYELEYGLRMAEALEATELLDYFNCDHGSYSSTWYEIPPFAIPEGSFRDLNRGLKAQSSLPVIASGRIRRAEMGEEILAAGEADLIGMARQLIADPYLVRRLEEGRGDEVRLCIACNDACVIQTGQGKPIRCVVNPAAGREMELGELTRRPAGSACRVVVVGGGPAGLKAAEVAARAGHHVTVLEREDTLGGQLRLAGRQPLHDEILDTTRHLERVCARLGVDVRLGVEAGIEDLLRLQPDAVIVATGSEPHLPARPHSGADDGALARALGRQIADPGLGLHLPHVRAVDECYEDDAPSDGTVLVVDGTGHWETLGTAELLAARGARVEVISARPLIGSNCDTAGRVLWHQRAIEHGIGIMPNVELVEVVPEGARVRELLTGAGRTILADVVVPVFSRRSREDLFLELAAEHGEEIAVVRIGDCVAPRLLQHAIAEGEAAGRAVSSAMVPAGSLA